MFTIDTLHENKTNLEKKISVLLNATYMFVGYFCLLQLRMSVSLFGVARNLAV